MRMSETWMSSKDLSISTTRFTSRFRLFDWAAKENDV